MIIEIKIGLKTVALSNFSISQSQTDFSAMSQFLTTDGARVRQNRVSDM